MSLIIVIGRGHSGTRAISHTLYASGVYMGACLNAFGDKIPAHKMYEACRLCASYVKRRGDSSWDFSNLNSNSIVPAFETLVKEYLADVLLSTAEHRGWKLPETTLCYPWIRRLFPEAKYIHWVRDPRDTILRNHLTDDLRRFGVESAHADDAYRRRALSWYYQHQLVVSVPRPEQTITVRFEDFVLRQENTVRRLETFLGIPLARIVVRPESVGRWRTDPSYRMIDFIEETLPSYGYERSTT